VAYSLLHWVSLTAGRALRPVADSSYCWLFLEAGSFGSRRMSAACGSRVTGVEHGSFLEAAVVDLLSWRSTPVKPIHLQLVRS